MYSFNFNTKTTSVNKNNILEAEHVKSLIEPEIAISNDAETGYCATSTAKTMENNTRIVQMDDDLKLYESEDNLALLPVTKYENFD